MKSFELILAPVSVKLLKEELTRLLNCKYLSRLPLPPNNGPNVVLGSPGESRKMMLLFTV